jgi:hypothetical protein
MVLVVELLRIWAGLRCGHRVQGPGELEEGRRQEREWRGARRQHGSHAPAILDCLARCQDPPLTRSAVSANRPQVEQLHLFTGMDTIAGTVAIKLNKGKKLDHVGIKVELIGQIGERFACNLRVRVVQRSRLRAELLYDRGNPYEFTSLTKDLEAPGA